ncbi:ATP-binding protein [Nonomuraea pusilla]|uniref:ATP-binding protein n=1 Tax=Nonomuraea pusilla TaxID=46177 RepID=UPI003333F42B
MEEFDVTASSIPRATFDCLASLEWSRASENYCAVGPAGTGKRHSLVAFGVAAVHAGHEVRYFTAAELVETLHRGLADDSVGRVIDNLLRNDLIIIDEVGFAPLDDTGAQLLFRFVAAAYERRALGIGSHWPFDQWGRFLPEHTTAVSLLDRLLHHSIVAVTEGESFPMKQVRTRTGGRQLRAGDLDLATSGDMHLAVDTPRRVGLNSRPPTRVSMKLHKGDIRGTDWTPAASSPPPGPRRRAWRPTGPAAASHRGC